MFRTDIIHKIELIRTNWETLLHMLYFESKMPYIAIPNSNQIIYELFLLTQCSLSSFLSRRAVIPISVIDMAASFANCSYGPEANVGDATSFNYTDCSGTSGLDEREKR